jgi:8-oxo-dGTP pyrophosphatase MutT (NUDIX family)
MGSGEIPAVGGRAANSPAVRVEQVAAVCYRMRGTSVEFLLVRTRKGRWTFPKGGAGEGLTYAQAAALEAFEEAGVHGRIEEASFARYRRGKSGGEKEAMGTMVHAFLCEVLRLGPAQELNRNRTWFSAEKTKWKLREGRESENAADMVRVVDCAVARIERLRHRTGATVDGLQRVQFEAGEITGGQKALYLRHIGGKRGDKDSAGIEFAVSAYVREMMGAGPLLNARRVPRLVEGNAGAARKVVQINRARKIGK